MYQFLTISLVVDENDIRYLFGEREGEKALEFIIFPSPKAITVKQLIIHAMLLLIHFVKLDFDFYQILYIGG